jgi:hypothetical protein
MKKMLVSVVAAASLAIPIGWVTAASATPQPDPDANGDLHSNCHTGSKFRGAGGEDGGPGNPKDTSDNGCAAAPVTPPGPTPGPGANPVSAPGAAPARAQGAAAQGAAQGAAVPVAGAAVPLQGVPRTTG